MFLIGLSIIAYSDNSAPKPLNIPQPEAQGIKEAYNEVIQANQRFQYAILQARYNMAVPKDWNLNLEKMQFVPPEPPPAERK